MKMLLKCIKSMVKFIFLVLLLSCLMTFIRLTVERPKHYKELKIPMLSRDFSYTKHSLNRKKYILVWRELDGKDWDFFRETDVIFEDNKCEYKNCYFTSDRKFFGKDYRKFDAVLFDGQSVVDSEYMIPKRRAQTQIYIFANKESAANYPVCDPKFDGFFNLTWTYRLDSDVPWPFFHVHDSNNNEVAPKLEVEWTKIYEPAADEYLMLVHEKDKAAIWIASNCFTVSRREVLFNRLKYLLRKAKLSVVDSVGACGLMQCPIELESECLKNMHKYFFFFAFENSLAKDYVTEKVEKAFRNYVVPVVFGEADYDKFLPPHSYIDVRGIGAGGTAKLLIDLMQNISLYLDYFRWRNHYEFLMHDSHVCKLCELLNSDFKKEYKDFRNWWNPKKLEAYGGQPKKVC